MIQDKQLEFSNAQAITASVASTNQIDTGPNGPWGAGKTGNVDVEVVLTPVTTFTAAGAATLTVGVRSSPNADMSGAVVHRASQAIPLADLAVGRRIPVEFTIPREADRYVDLFYTVTTGPFTAGALTARGGAGRQLNV